LLRGLVGFGSLRVLGLVVAVAAATGREGEGGERNEVRCLFHLQLLFKFYTTLWGKYKKVFLQICIKIRFFI
jgi:hypothetical protein